MKKIKPKNNLASQKNIKKGNTGITLIALVVTIIVLLILAGISISMLSGDNGILQKAIETKEVNRAGTVQEQRDMWKLAQETDNFTSTSGAESLDALLERLGPNSQKLLTSDEIDTIKETGQVTIAGRTIIFGLPEEEDNLEIGDVVEATGLAKFKDSSNNDIEWIYFGKDDSGNKLVTTAKPLKEKFTMNEQPDNDSTKKIENSAKNWLYYDLQYGETGYDDTECTVSNNINKFCENLYNGLYSANETPVGTARSITLEDINRVTGYTEPTFIPITFGTGTGEYNYYYPTLENKDSNPNANPKVYKYWKKPTGASEKTFTTTEIHPAYYYNSSTCTSENMKYVIGEDSSNYLSYAVGSRSVYVSTIGAYSTLAYVDSDDMDFHVAHVEDGYVASSGYYTFCYSDSNHGYGSGINPISTRPIVSLGSGVKLHKVQ